LRRGRRAAEIRLGHVLPTVLLFDLDDTILDDSGGATDSCRTACDDAVPGWRS
jgi:hypothetical protein